MFTLDHLQLIICHLGSAKSSSMLCQSKFLVFADFRGFFLLFWFRFFLCLQPSTEQKKSGKFEFLPCSFCLLLKKHGNWKAVFQSYLLSILLWKITIYKWMKVSWMLEVYLPGLCIKPLFLFCVSFSELHQSSTLRFLLVTFCIYWIHSSFSASLLASGYCITSTVTTQM